MRWLVIACTLLLLYSCTMPRLGPGARSLETGFSFRNSKHPMHMADEIELEEWTLTLRGKGFDEKHPPRIYHAGLYTLNEPNRNEDILARREPLVLRLHVGRSVYRENLFKIWTPAYNTMIGDDQDTWDIFDVFRSVFPYELERGDRLDLIYTPQNGVEIRLFQNLIHRFEEGDDALALFDLWLGEKPLDPGLKRNLLWSGNSLN